MGYIYIPKVAICSIWTVCPLIHFHYLAFFFSIFLLILTKSFFSMWFSDILVINYYITGCSEKKIKRVIKKDV